MGAVLVERRKNISPMQFARHKKDISLSELLVRFVLRISNVAS